MFSSVINLVGTIPFFIVALLLATMTTPFALVVRRRRPYIGVVLVVLGVLLQVGFGVATAVSLVFPEVREFFLGPELNELFINMGML